MCRLFFFSFWRCGTCIGRRLKLLISSKIWMDICEIFVKYLLKKYFVNSLHFEGRIYDLKQWFTALCSRLK